MYSVVGSHLPYAGPAAVTGLVDRARSWAILAGLLVGLGALALRAMRSRNLHWSWGLVAVAVVALAHAPLGSLAPPLLLASGWVTRRARRAHLERLELAADLGKAAASSAQPSDAAAPRARFDRATSA